MTNIINKPAFSFWMENIVGTPLFILLSGKMGVGKTTVAELIMDSLADSNRTAMRESFATGVKETAKTMGWNDVKDEVGRKLLQDVGMKGRNNNPNLWVDQVIDRVQEKQMFIPDIIVIDDWRFPNEADRLKELGFDIYKVRIESSVRGEPSSHISETSLDNYTDFDVYIYNDDTKEKLAESIDMLLGSLI